MLHVCKTGQEQMVGKEMMWGGGLQGVRCCRAGLCSIQQCSADDNDAQANRACM